MASDDELLGAIDKAVGANQLDTARELALVLKQQRMRNEPLPEPAKLGQAGMPDAIRQVAKESGVGEQRLAGIGSAPMLAGQAIKQLGGADNSADIQNTRALQSATGNTQMGNMAGNALMFGAAPAGAVGTGMAMAGRTLPRLGTVADVAGTQGALAAALTPGDVVDRGLAGAMGAGSVAVPGSVGAVQGARRVATKAGRQLSLAEALRGELGPDADKLAGELDSKTYAGSNYGVQPSAAMLTRNPTLEVMETGSRVRTGDQWANFDRMNAAARWKALEDAAGSPEDLVKLRGARDAFTGPQRDEALGSMGGTFFGTGHKLAPLAGKLEEFATGAMRPNKEVQTMVNYVKGELDKGSSPEQLYTIRKMLTDGIAAGPTSELSQAARAARPQRMEIIGEIDKALNDMSGGKWATYLENYKLASPLISSKAALQKMTDALTSGRPAGEVPASMGERPAPLTLGRLNERFGSKQFGSQEFDQLIPQHRQLVDALISDLNAQSGVMLPKGTLGSPTASNMANAGRVNQVTNSMVDAAGNLIPVGGGTLAAAVKGGMQRRNEEALAELLKNPAALSEALNKAKIAQALLNKSGRIGSGADAAIRQDR